MKRPKTYILQEDAHLQNLRKIIKRDYFAPTFQSQIAPNLTLNSYLNHFTSNQNKTFSELIAKDREQWKKEHWWIDNDNKDKIKMITQGKLDDGNQENSSKTHRKSIEYHQYRNMIEGDKDRNGINHQIIQMEGRNPLFFRESYGKEMSYLTKQDEQRKKVVYSNCRLGGNDQLLRKADSIHQKQFQSQRGKQAALEQRGDELQPSGVPIMTWGEVQSTPLRLSGPEYRIPQTPIRDQLLTKLNQKIKKQKVQQGKKKSQLVMRILGSVTPASRRQISSYHKGKQSSHQSSVRGANNSQRKVQGDGLMDGLLNIKTNKDV